MNNLFKTILGLLFLYGYNKLFYIGLLCNTVFNPSLLKVIILSLTMIYSNYGFTGLALHGFTGIVSVIAFMYHVFHNEKSENNFNELYTSMKSIKDDHLSQALDVKNMKDYFYETTNLDRETTEKNIESFTNTVKNVSNGYDIVYDTFTTNSLLVLNKFTELISSTKPYTYLNTTYTGVKDIVKSVDELVCESTKVIVAVSIDDESEDIDVELFQKMEEQMKEQMSEEQFEQMNKMTTDLMGALFGGGEFNLMDLAHPNISNSNNTGNTNNTSIDNEIEFDESSDSDNIEDVDVVEDLDDIDVDDVVEEIDEDLYNDQNNSEDIKNNSNNTNDNVSTNSPEPLD